MVMKVLALPFCTNCLFFLIVAEFFKYQKYGECSHYYRLNINHTSGTPKILPKLGQINNLHIKTVKKESEPFDVRAKM